MDLVGFDWKDAHDFQMSEEEEFEILFGGSKEFEKEQLERLNNERVIKNEY